MREYPIFEHDTQVGNVTVYREGLYYKMRCCYQTKMKSHYLMCCGMDKVFVLGTGIPGEQNWTLRRFIPTGLLPNKSIKYILVEASRMQRLTLGEPIANISQVVKGKLHHYEDGYWVIDSESL